MSSVQFTSKPAEASGSANPPPPTDTPSDRQQNPDGGDGDSGSDSDEDQDEEAWDDWVSDSAANQPCRSLFDGEKVLPSLAEAAEFDKREFGVGVGDVCAKLGLDFHKKIRLVNYIRKEKPTPESIQSLTGQEPFFTSDDYLIPVVEDDPYLQLPTDEPWSDDESPTTNLTYSNPSFNPAELDSSDPTTKIKALEAQNMALKRRLAQMELLKDRLGDSGSDSEVEDAGKGKSVGGEKREGKVGKEKRGLRDDDSHYFQSYGEHDIPAVMIQDKVRTSTYASFILRNPSVFQDKIVMDVGCGTGILSLFAAKGGAKKVYAVDASEIAEKAEEIVRVNGMGSVITVIRGKVEDIALPDSTPHVDVIISEWMGYALLYESMLDSVLYARDKFLKPEGGVMAPSQCDMMLALCDAGEVLKDRVEFWDDVYGFDLSTMSHSHFTEAIIDILPPSSLLSHPTPIKHIPISHPSTTPSSLDFDSSFTLTSTSSKRTKLTAFVLYFDTFFTRSGKGVEDGTVCSVVRADEMQVAEIWAVGGGDALKRRRSVSVGKAKSKERLDKLAQEDAARAKGGAGGDGEGAKGAGEGEAVVDEEPDLAASFSTGPQSMATHWKQTIFLLKDPVNVVEGSIVQGKFFCTKSAENSRELDVEIHYSVKQRAEDPDDGKVTVQMYKVR